MIDEPVILPDLEWVPTQAKETRDGHPVQLVVVHRWGVAYTTPTAEASAYAGVKREFLNPASQASAHFVYPGSAVKAGAIAAQMVPYAEAAWTEKAYNRYSVEVESADAIWLGHDPHGFRVLARIVAFLLHRYSLPATWAKPLEPGDPHHRGFCRHADLGTAGGGHTACPTTDLKLWGEFVHAVAAETTRGGFRPSWGR